MEPHPKLFEQACRHLRWNREHVSDVDLVNRAVSDSNGRLSLHIPESQDYGKTSAHPTRNVGSTVDVEATTLDTLTEELEIKEIDFLKIDIEGHEPQAITGGMNAIEQSRPTILFEFNPDIYGSKDESLSNVFQWMMGIGYSFHEIGWTEADGFEKKTVDLIDRCLWMEGQKDVVAEP